MGCVNSTTDDQPSAKSSVKVAPSVAINNNMPNREPDHASHNQASNSIEKHRSSSQEDARKKALIENLQQQGKTLIRALYDYVSPLKPGETDTPDLNFRKDDVMEVIEQDGDWWLAENIMTHKEGFVPFTYIALINSIDSFEWFHGDVNRPEASRLLLNPGNTIGTFLIRKSETGPGPYSLSVRDVDDGKPFVRQYKIKVMDNGYYYITTKKQFATLEEMVAHYQSEADGLCGRLTKPCPKPSPTTGELSRDVWEIPKEDVKLVRTLGKGNFGEVHEGLWRGTRAIAVKTLKPGTMSVEMFLEEANILKTLRHPKIVSLFAVCSVNEPLYIITELMVNGSLLSYLQNQSLGPFLTFPQLIGISSQIAEGMAYIETKSLIHRDLAARNILVGSDINTVKIGDFGLAKSITEDEYTAQKGSKFPIKWTSPEALVHGRFSIKSDVWAYGILLVEIFTCGCTPYPGMNNRDVMDRLQQSSFHHSQPASCPNEVYDIMLECWRRDPAKRPTFEHLYCTMHDFDVATEPSYKDVN